MAEVDGAVQEARRSGRPRRGGAKRRVREPALLDNHPGLPASLPPALLPPEDALKPADDLLVGLYAVHAPIASLEFLCVGFAEYSRLEDPLVGRSWAAFLVFADIPPCRRASCQKKKKKMGKLLSPGIPPIDERRGNLIECSTVVMSQLIIIECVIFAIIISCGALLSYS